MNRSVNISRCYLSLFIVCYRYPLYVINLIDYFWPKFSIAEMTLWTVVLSHMSCGLNPLIYAYGMPGFKKAFRELFNIDTEKNNTGLNSCYFRSSFPLLVHSSSKSRSPQQLRKISAPTPIIRRN
ncbi:hypothetical protein DICVIV_02607 [Dictyocaulus viviparus]|uniref:G-protein coupled receptors family 1 profile domain-containing protein n=1 Tax=Dictyocaulus viviparus TaxID=29172 RepID=A0A0D8Y4Z4_DICVI|nr:hypothetical protein DICVIV_02607 [Dictyocaulus viviparus]